jgi:hypothetical protein
LVAGAIQGLEWYSNATGKPKDQSEPKPPAERWSDMQKRKMGGRG